MGIRHVVTWKIAGEDADVRASRIESIKSALEALPPLISDIQSLQAGVNTLYGDKNWHLVLIADFESIEALESYVAHPAHQALVAKHKDYFEERVAVDYEF